MHGIKRPQQEFVLKMQGEGHYSTSIFVDSSMNILTPVSVEDISLGVQ